MIDIDKLEKLLTYGSPTPWTVYDGEDHWKVTTGPRIVFDDGSACGEYGPECSEADRELIVALANAAPALFAELRRLRAIETAATKLVDRWGHPYPAYLMVPIIEGTALKDALAAKENGK